MLAATIDVARAQNYLAGLPDKIDASVLKAMFRAVIELQSYIRANKLHGDPLHQRSGNLSRETLTQPDPYRSGNTIIGTVGTSRAAYYGKVHEDGGTYDIPEHYSMSRKGRKFIVRPHQATFPQRSYLRSALAENVGHITEVVRGAVQEAIQ
ncbi:MAG TPA: hypothetical protein VKV17_12770 [Bryobacteraceae bacterium]|nr:hypothetical protein [Bryobacteraceae bacterium]